MEYDKKNRRIFTEEEKAILGDRTALKNHRKSSVSTVITIWIAVVVITAVTFGITCLFYDTENAFRSTMFIFMLFYSEGLVAPIFLFLHPAFSNDSSIGLSIFLLIGSALVYEKENLFSAASFFVICMYAIYQIVVCYHFCTFKIGEYDICGFDNGVTAEQRTIIRQEREIEKMQMKLDTIRKCISALILFAFLVSFFK